MREEPAEMVRLPVCQGDRQMKDRWTDSRANQECFPVANLTDIRMQYNWTGGVSERTDRLDVERGRPADRMSDRQMDSSAYSRQGGDGLKQVRVGWPVCLLRSCMGGLTDRQWGGSCSWGAETRVPPHVLSAGEGTG